MPDIPEAGKCHCCQCALQWPWLPGWQALPCGLRAAAQQPTVRHLHAAQRGRLFVLAPCPGKLTIAGFPQRCFLFWPAVARAGHLLEQFPVHLHMTFDELSVIAMRNHPLSSASCTPEVTDGSVLSPTDGSILAIEAEAFPIAAKVAYAVISDF